MDADEILIAQKAYVYLADVGTVAPADDSVALDPDWRNVGYFTPDSLKLNDEPAFGQVESHQSLRPTRRFQTGETESIAVDLQQWSGDNFRAVYGGGVLSEITPGHFKFVKPNIGERGDVAAIIEVIDGTKRYRWVVPRCTQVEGVELGLQRTAESILPLRLEVMGSDVGDPSYLLTNDDSFAPAA